MLTGGSLYEKNIAEVLNEEYLFDVLELDPDKYAFLKFKRLKYFFQVYNYKILEPGVLICSTAGLLAGINLNKFKQKILIIHHFDPHDSTNPIFKNYFHRIILARLKRFDKIVVVCDYWKNYFKNYVPESKIEVIYNSFNPQEIDDISRNFDKIKFKKKFNIPLDKKIVYGGNALKSKGIELLNKLLAGSDFHIVTSGSKDRNYGNQHVLLSYKDYLRLLSVSDVSVLLSSLREGWNRCAHESLLCGTPVIGTNIAGLGELLTRTGQKMFDERVSLVEQINEVIASDSGANFGRAYIKKLDQEYFKKSWFNLLNNSM